MPTHRSRLVPLYPLAKADDDAVARDLLTLLFEVYGYDGRQKFRAVRE